MRGVKIDLKGKRFGRWTVLDEAGRRRYNGEIAWRCRCDCGNYGTVAGADLRRGISKGCRDCGYKHMRKETQE